MKKITKQTILVLSDMHIPYQHPDMLSFLKAVKKKFKPTNVVCIGDEVDMHDMSFHDSNPDLDAAGIELERSIEILKPIYKLFPDVSIVESNHGSMLYRKGLAHKIPKKMLKGYNEVLEAPKGWKWYKEVRIKSPTGDILFRHSFGKNILAQALANGCSCVQGHFHEDFSVLYAGNSYKLLFGMTVGCLIDDESMAFAYNKNFAKRPVIGVAVIIDGVPQLVPMPLNKKGRWNGKL